MMHSVFRPFPVVMLLIMFALILSPCSASARSESGESAPPAAAESPADSGEDVAEKPLWEFVLFNTVSRIPHYRGADEADWYILPLPYFIYRGEFFQVDRQGVRGIFFRSEYFESDISLFGNPPVEDDNEAREGMPDLDALGEVGPSIKWYFTGRDPLNDLYLRAALRGAFSVSFDDVDLEYEGLHGGFNLIYNNRRMFQDRQIRFGFNIGIDFTDSGYNGYFYDVAEDFVRPDRPAYNADGGYAGFSVGVSGSKRLTDTLSMGVYTRWDNIEGAAFEDSPLVKQKNNIFFGAVLTWRIAASKKMVRIEGVED